MLVAIAASACVVALVAFVPPFQVVFLTESIYAVQLAPPACAGALLLVYWTVKRRVILRKYGPPAPTQSPPQNNVDAGASGIP